MFDITVHEVLLEGYIIEGLSLSLLGKPVDADAVVFSVGAGRRLLWILCSLFGL